MAVQNASCTQWSQLSHIAHVTIFNDVNLFRSGGINLLHTQHTQHKLDWSTSSSKSDSESDSNMTLFFVFFMDEVPLVDGFGLAFDF